jgi:DNA-directed RNA polymerase II subunit RPB2
MSRKKTNAKTLPLTKKPVKVDDTTTHVKFTPLTKELTLDDKMWEVSDAFIDQYGLVSMHLASFNCAIEEMIPTIVEEKGKICLVRNGQTHRVEINNLIFTPPVKKNDSGIVSVLTPKMCMDESTSYTAGIHCDIIYKGPNGQYNKYEKKYIGDIYIPVYSNLCVLSKIKGDKQQLAAWEEDINDVGGYYIVKGSPKVIVPQVRPSHNNIHIYTGKAVSTNSKPKFSKYTETRCGGLTSHITTVQVGICIKTHLVSASIPYIDSCSIPLGILFCALGLKNSKEISSFVFEKKWFSEPPSPKHKNAILLLVKTLERSWPILNEKDPQRIALHYIGVRSKKGANKPHNQNLSQKDLDIEYEQIVNSAKMLLSSEFLPHIGSGENYNIEKCIFLGYMVRKLLLCHVGLLPISDRDHTANKRIHTSGMIMAAHFYKAFCQLTGKIVSCIDADVKKNKPVNVASYITQPHIITTSFTSALMANKWNTGPVQGISQTIDNFNFVSALSFLRKFIIPMANEGGKIEPPRHLHGSQWGTSCPYETPEGKKVGLVQILPMDASVTVGCDHRPVIEFLKDMNIIGITELVKKNAEGMYDMNDFLSYTRIFVNGIPQGCTRFPEEIVNTLVGLRRKCNINPFISIAHDNTYKEIKISTDAGRSYRGLVTLKNGEISIPEKLLDEMRQYRLGLSHNNLKFTSEKSVWTYLLENGYVELIDKDEEENLNVAIYPSDLESMPPSTRMQYTHCEMTPDMIEGIGANTSPKNDCNQAPRNIYQSAMAKQAIGVPGLNHLYHRKSKWHSLVYPQKPIINTRIARKVGLDNVPMGQNATVIVMPWYGYNQEDSLVINSNAVDRGFMCSYAYVAHEAVIKNVELPGSVKFESFEIPKKEICNDYRGNPSKLIQNGKWCYVPEGIEVKKGDILIGMTITHAANARYVNSSIYTKNKTNISIIYDQKWPATVHSILCGKNGDGFMCIKLVTRQYRKPVRGDKFAARHGQKGTAGELVDSSEMPFLTRLGYTPNILLNPLAFPSRMTIGALIEAVMGISLSASALKCPEYCMPLCLDGSSTNPSLCNTKDLKRKDYSYSDGFNPQENYNMGLDGDASPFVKSFDRDYVLECIKKLGVPGFCEEEVMNPQTGKKLKVLIFSGVIYYQRLRHMVVDKIHARSTGSHHGLHRQPTEGRKKKGGFRVGFMEKDCMLGQGIPEMAQDRLLYQSDVYKMPICQVCGLTAIDDGKSAYCRLCQTSKIVTVQLPFGTKLFSQEISVLNSVPRIITLPEPK